MNNLLKRTKMMEESREQGRKFFPAIELLIFMAVFMIASYAQSFLLILFGSVYFFMDPAFRELFSDVQNLDVQAVLDRFSELLEIAPEWLFILNIFLSIAFAVATVIYCCCIDKRSLSSIGIRKNKAVSDYFIGLLLGFASMTCIATLGVAIGVFKFNGFAKISIPVLIFYFIAFVFQAFSEELMVRGYYLTSVTKTASPIYAVISNGILFVLLHFMTSPASFLGVVNIFLFAVFTSIYVIKRGNIWAVSAFHFAWNFSQIVLFGFNDGKLDSSAVFDISFVKGFDSITGGAYGPEGGLLVTFVLFIAIGIVYKSKQNPEEIAVIQNNDCDEEKENEEAE